MSFKIGGTLSGIDNPKATFLGYDIYGTNIKGSVYGPFEAWRYSWSILTNTQWLRLKPRLDAAKGLRVLMTIPLNSPENWQQRYGEPVLQPGFTFEGSEVLNVVVDVLRVSNDPDS